MGSALEQRTRGRWPQILPALRIDPGFLTGKHMACPICREGKDRFRFDDKEGRGTWICSHCGAGDGVALVMKFHRIDFHEAACRIEALIGQGHSEAGEIQPERRSDEQNCEALRALWTASRPIAPVDPAAIYLRRRVGLNSFPACLRTIDRMRYQDELASYHPGMVALVTGPDGNPVSLHRTYLTKDGDKAAVLSPKRLMPGKLMKGSAIRLAHHGRTLGIAEGIETALAASALFGVPCWAAINARMLEAWTPPEEVDDVIIFGDNDESFTGQAAAYGLAQRIRRSDVSVRIEIPDTPGEDWADFLNSR